MFSICTACSSGLARHRRNNNAQWTVGHGVCCSTSLFPIRLDINLSTSTISNGRAESSHHKVINRDHSSSSSITYHPYLYTSFFGTSYTRPTLCCDSSTRKLGSYYELMRFWLYHLYAAHLAVFSLSVSSNHRVDAD